VDQETLRPLNRRHVHGLLNTGPYVIRTEFWIVVSNDLFERAAVAHQLEDVLHWNASAGHTGFAKVNPRINRNSLCHTAESLTPN
jgi:hypothetical protein